MNLAQFFGPLGDERLFVVYRADKSPIDPETQLPIDAQVATNRMTLAEADMWVTVGLGAGVGVVISPEHRMAFVDLDHARDAAGWQPHAVNFLERFPGAYVEVSMSGEGLHVLFQYSGERPLHRVKNKDYRAECYTGGRYCALTGNGARGSVLTDCGAALREFTNQFFPPREESDDADGWRTAPVAAWKGPSDDDELLRRAMAATSIKAIVIGKATFRDLWVCNVEALGRTFPSSTGQAYDGSSADLALFNHLSFWCGGDCDRMLRIASRPDCGMRREKWNREKYLRDTILRAATDQTEFYKERAGEAPPPTSNAWGAAIAGAATPPESVVATVAIATQDAPVQVVMTTQAPAPPPPPSKSFLPPTQAPHALTLDSKNHYEATLPNLIHVLGLQQNASFGFDTFRGQIMVAFPGGEWHSLADVDIVNLREALERQNFASISASLMRDSLLAVATRNSYDSAIVWASGLKWDGVPRIDNFLHVYCGAEDDAYTRAVSRYIWTGLPARVFEPGCQLDMVVAFQSKQGTRKSSGLQALAPAPEYFTDNVSLAHDNDDFKRVIRGKIVVEIAELAGLGKAEVEFVKRMITRKFEEWVEKWQVMTTRYPRRCMMFASTNNKQFLPQDETGQRRWLPVEIEQLVDSLIARDRDQLWAEGVQRWQQLKNAGLPGVDFREAEELAKARHSKYEQQDVWESKIKAWLEAEISVEGGAPIIPAPKNRPLHISEVLEGAIRMTTDKMNRSAEVRAAAVLRGLGYEKKSVRVAGFKNPVDRWVAPE